MGTSETQQGEAGGARAGGRPPAARPPRARTIVLLVALFFLGFLFASQGITRLSSEIYGIANPAQLPLEEADFKEILLLRKLRTREGTPYGLFFGPSTMRHGVIPEVFDRTLEEQGIATWSFNFGIEGAGGHEVDYLARRVIARIEDEGLPPPQWVVVDLTLPHHRLTLARNSENVQNLRSARSVRWHDFYQTVSVVQTILRLKSAPTRVKLHSIALHLEAFARRSLDFSGIWQKLRSMNRNTKSREVELRDIADHRGFAPYEGEVYEMQRKMFLKHRRESYLATIRDRDGDDFAGSLEVENYNDEAVRRQADDLSRRGIQVVYIIAPTHRDTRFVQALTGRSDLPPVLRYDRPSAFPELYAPEHRQDEGHLSCEGAALYSEQLARDLAAILKDSRRD